MGAAEAEPKIHHCSLLCQPNTACLSHFSASQALTQGESEENVTKKQRFSLLCQTGAVHCKGTVAMALKQQITTSGFALVSLQSKVNKNSLTGRP